MASSILELLQWKRRIFELYADVRRAPDPKVAWWQWTAARDALYRTHPQTPLSAEQLLTFRGIDYFDYTPAYRVLAEIVPTPEEPVEIAGSAGSLIRFHRFARARFALAGEDHELELFWLEGYGGGVFLPFGDTSNGRSTYHAGRYLLDSVKGADLGMMDDRLVLDFNFAYNPSCSYDERWACPLTPPSNRLPIDVVAGERTPATVS